MTVQDIFSSEDVWDAFEKNWVFKLYSRQGLYQQFPPIKIRNFGPWIKKAILSNNIRTAIFISFSIWLLGFIGSLLFGAPQTYLFSSPPILNALSIALALIAFAWFTDKLSYVLVRLSTALNISPQDLRAIVQKWANRANIWTILLVSLFYAILNFRETVAIWQSPNPPLNLLPWTTSHASLFFGFFYGFLHVIIVPFILGSGTVGMVGVVLLLRELLNQPLRLEHFREMEVVIELTAWLLMWILVALATILLFGRSIIINRANILASDISGVAQALLATIVLISLGFIPLSKVHGSINEAKRAELKSWIRYKQIRQKQLKKYLEKTEGKFQAAGDQATAELRILKEEIETIDTRIKDVENIPTIPIRWPSIARVSLGTILSLGSPFLREWVEKRIPLP